MRRAAIGLFTALLLFGCGGGGGGGGSQSAFCVKAVELTSLDQVLNDASNPEKLALATKSFDELTAAAPSEIKDDMAKLNEVYKKIADALKDVDPNNPDAAFAAVFALIGEFDQQEIQTATSNVEKYAKDQCGIDLTATTEVAAGATTTTIALGDTTTTSTAGGDTTTTTTPADTTNTTGSISNLPPADPVPGGTDEQLNALAQQCHDGDMQACDDLFNQSDFDSAYEDYGNTCGGRVPNNTDFCVDVYP